MQTEPSRYSQPRVEYLDGKPVDWSRYLDVVDESCSDRRGGHDGMHVACVWSLLGVGEGLVV